MLRQPDGSKFVFCNIEYISILLTSRFDLLDDRSRKNGVSIVFGYQARLTAADHPEGQDVLRLDGGAY